MIPKSCRVLTDILLPAFVVCWIFYFAFDSVASASGVRSLRKLEATIDSRAAELSNLSEQRELLEKTARQLNPRSLNPDVIDEKIRAILGYVAEGDVVIPRDQLDEVLSDIRKQSR